MLKALRYLLIFQLLNILYLSHDWVTHIEKTLGAESACFDLELKICHKGCQTG